MASSSQANKEKVVRSFDYSKFDNIDISDDEETFHPNIENNFNVKINRHVRDRKIYEHEEEKKVLMEKKDDPKALKRLQELERKKIWFFNLLYIFFLQI